MTPRLYRLLVEDHPRFVLEQDGGYRLVEGEPLGAWQPGAAVSPGTRHPLVPVMPGKLVGIGRNYRDHVAERNNPIPKEPLVFLKPTSAVIGPGEAIVLPPDVGRIDHEGELGLVIGRRATKVRPEQALEFVLGLTCVNDVTARSLQDRGFQFSHVKGFDTFAPIGPCVLMDPNPHGRVVECLVNGEVRQRASTDDMIFPVEELIAYVSRIMTLMPGDVIATGTPAGIGPLHPGDTVTVRVAGVGELTNPVVGTI